MLQLKDLGGTKIVQTDRQFWRIQAGRKIRGQSENEVGMNYAGGVNGCSKMGRIPPYAGCFRKSEKQRR